MHNDRRTTREYDCGFLSRSSPVRQPENQHLSFKSYPRQNQPGPYLGIPGGDSLDKNKSALSLIVRSIAVILPLTFSVVSAAAQGVTVIADLGQTKTDGVVPLSPLVFDKAGNLYGATYEGGRFGFGTVFELTTKSDGIWARKTLHSLYGWRRQPARVARFGCRRQSL